MNQNDQHIELFDAYLKRSLSPEEIVAFEKRLSDDKEFSESFNIYALLVEGVKEHSRQKLKDFLRDNTSMPHVSTRPKFFNLRSMQWSIAAAIVLIMGLFLIVQFYIKPQEVHSDLAKEDVIGKPDTPNGIHYENPNSTSTDTTQFIEMLAVKKESADQEAPPALEDVTPNSIDDNNLGAVEAGSPEIYQVETSEKLQIQSETKLLDTTFVLSLLIVSNDGSNFGDNTAPKNATTNNYDSKPYSKAKIPSNKTESDVKREPSSETEVKKLNKNNDLKVHVEYWKSPINFKGYQYSGTNLILYGVTKDNSKLYYYNNSVYLRHNNSVYKLTPSNTSIPYKLETDPSITSIILAQ